VTFFINYLQIKRDFNLKIVLNKCDASLSIKIYNPFQGGAKRKIIFPGLYRFNILDDQKNLSTPKMRSKNV